MRERTLNDDPTPLGETLAATEGPSTSGKGPELAGALPVGSSIGRYVVLGTLGSGGMGVVLAAYDPELDRKVAIKLLRVLEVDGRDTTIRARLLREAQAIARLNHPNVVAVHDVGVHEGRVFVAMEFVDGGTLGDWMRGRSEELSSAQSGPARVPRRRRDRRRARAALAEARVSHAGVPDPPPPRRARPRPRLPRGGGSRDGRHRARAPRRAPLRVPARAPGRRVGRIPSRPASTSSEPARPSRAPTRAAWALSPRPRPGWLRAGLSRVRLSSVRGARGTLAASLFVVACTASEPSSPSRQPAEAKAPAKPEAPVPEPETEPSTPSDAAEIEAQALACQGSQLATRFAALGHEELERLANQSEHPSARLLARWELARSFGEDDTLDPAGITELVVAVEAELGQPPPKWWAEQLAAARRHAGSSMPGYDTGRTESGDRRGPWVPGPGDTRVRPGDALLVSEHGGKLGYELSSRRVELGPLPAAGELIETARARAGTTIYWTSFSQGSGGFRFPLHAIAGDGRELWTAQVCGPDRKVLGGLGHLTVEILPLEPPADGSGRKPGTVEIRGVAVFSAESHGLALDVFDPETGARTLAWSSDFWFAR